MKASVECQTNEGVFLSKEEYEKLTEKPDIKGDLEKLKTFLLSYDPQPTVMDVDKFQNICMQAGATNLFSTLYDAMTSSRMSDERQDLTKLRVMVVIYVMMYSQSQRAKLVPSITCQNFTAIWNKSAGFGISTQFGNCSTPSHHESLCPSLFSISSEQS
jgi:hypothetical protein